MAGAVVTPGFAKPRSELPWLPYWEQDRVIINAHNFTPAFIPTDVAGLRSWHDASDVSTLYDATSNGSAVAADAAIARWEDKSGNGWHLINATSGERPLRKTAIQNSLDCVLFDGIDDKLATFSNFSETGDADVSVFVAYQKTASTQGYLFGWGNVFLSLGAFGLYDDGIFTAVAFAGNNNFILTSINTSFNLLSILKSTGAINTTTTSRLNRTSNASTGHSTSTPNIQSNPFALGRWANFTGIFKGYVGEVIIYDSKISDANRDSVESYLRTKWGTP